MSQHAVATICRYMKRCSSHRWRHGAQGARKKRNASSQVCFNLERKCCMVCVRTTPLDLPPDIPPDSPPGLARILAEPLRCPAKSCKPAAPRNPPPQAPRAPSRTTAAPPSPAPLPNTFPSGQPHAERTTAAQQNPLAHPLWAGRDPMGPMYFVLHDLNKIDVTERWGQTCTVLQLTKNCRRGGPAAAPATPIPS